MYDEGAAKVSEREGILEADLWSLAPEFLDEIRRTRELTPNTQDAYTRDMQYILMALACGKPVASPSLWNRERLTAVVEGMTAKAYSPRSIERMLCTWRQFSQFLIRRGLIEHNPLKRVAAPSFVVNQPRTLQRGVVLRALERLDSPDERDRRDRLILELVCGCGLRVAELAELTTADIDVAAGVVHVRSGASPRGVPLPERVRMAYHAYMRASDRSASALATPLLQGLGRVEISHRTVQRIVELRIAELVGEKKITSRSLRQAFVFWLLEAGYSLDEVRHVTGHLRLASTQRYADLLAVRRERASQSAESSPSVSHAGSIASRLDHTSCGEAQ